MTKVRLAEPEGFPAFWSIWLPIARRNDGRGLARETYRKHMLAGAHPQDIIDGARWYARGVTEENRKFVPLSSTWLNRCAYEDNCEQERAFQARQQEQAERAVNVTQLQPRKTAFLEAWEAQNAREA